MNDPLVSRQMTPQDHWIVLCPTGRGAGPARLPTRSIWTVEEFAAELGCSLEELRRRVALRDPSRAGSSDDERGIDG